MKKSLLLLFSAVLFFNSINAQSLNFQWAKNMGGAGTTLAEGLSTAIDTFGNVYSTGYFTGTGDFDPSAGVFNLVASGTTKDVFITKLNSSGNFLWALRIGGTGGIDIGRSISVDDSSNVYVTGPFQGTVDFNPGAGIYNLTPTGGYGIFILKLNSAGNFLWAKIIETSDVLSLALDSASNVYVTGGLIAPVDMDPSAAVYTLSPSAANGYVYLLKLDFLGNFVWAKQLGGVSDGANAIAINKNTGNIYLTGSFLGTGDFDPGAGTYNLIGASGIRNFFVVALDALGSFIWANSISGTTDGCVGSSIGFDIMDNVYATGYFRSINIVVGSTTLVGGDPPDPNTFVCKLNPSGNYLWAKSFSSIYDNHGNSIAIDKNGNSYITGPFFGTADFDPGTSAFNLTPVGSLNYSCFVTKLDSLGSFIWAFQMRGVSSSTGTTGYSIRIDSFDNIYTTGSFYQTVDFDPGTTVFSLSAPSASSLNVFVQKLSQTSITTNTINLESENSVNVYPNPFTSETTIFLNKELKGGQIKITDVYGKEVRVLDFSGMQGVVSKGELRQGVYFLQVLSENKVIANRKIIIQ